MQSLDHFIGQAEQLLEGHKGEKRYLVISVDIAHFQAVNHCYGTKAGDRLLHEVEKALEDDVHIVYQERIFADLFLCLGAFEKDVGNEEISQYLKKYWENFKQAQSLIYLVCNWQVVCGAGSIEGIGLKEAVEIANAARKIAKEENQIVMLEDSSLLAKLREQYEKEQELNQALKDEKFCFYLQPKVNLVSGEIVGAEALVRRLDQNGQEIFPDDFLPLMEENGSILELDLMVCRKVCAYLRERLDARLPVVCTSVNLSRLHINNPDTARLFHETALRYQIPSELLEFELTETILLDEFTGTKKLIENLRSYGYQVAIDDFGSGYAGINIWQELDFDVLKLDKLFLREDTYHKARNEALVPNIINIGQRLHADVLCEGVETKEQCQYLLSLGCTLAQGFYFSKPVPPEQFYALYQKMDGQYPLVLSKKKMDRQGIRTKEAAAAKNSVSGPAPRGWMRYVYFAVIIVSVFLLIWSFEHTTRLYREMTQEKFKGMIEETLDAYIAAQKQICQGKITNVEDTLNAYEVLFSQNSDPEYIESCIQALNDSDPTIVFQYTPADALWKVAEKMHYSEADWQLLKRLESGEMVVSNVRFSKQLGNAYYYAVAVPVIKDGNFIGALRGILDATELVSTSQYPPSQGRVIASFLTDGAGNMVPVQADGSDDCGTVYDFLKNKEEIEISRQGLDDLNKKLYQFSTHSIQLGESEGTPVYLTMTRLDYNDLYLSVLVYADKAQQYSEDIVHNTTKTSTYFLLCLIVFSAVLLMVFRQMQQRLSEEERRYMLLGQFSDTVLFDYDCRSDTIHFTDNAKELFRADKLVKHRFLRSLQESGIYAGDLDTVQHFLTGKNEEGKNEARIRFLQPDADDYFWCLVQFHYVYDGNTIVSVIGKIMDIDQQKRWEDALVEKSTTDGLTGLYNRAAAQERICRALETVEKGMLLVMDIDDFKHINDGCGHQTGDEVLRYTTGVLRRMFRSEDILGRMGGDELVVFISGLDSHKVVEEKVDAILRVLREYSQGKEFQLTLSVGGACFPRDSMEYQQLFVAADEAMYEAKAQGKGRCCFYSRQGRKV
ncbi:MAG: EAL domain-containing protein [Blautia sp.]|jgi:diguanylate cyclase (GGDEF)-like protein